jgi:hypothetical protein
VILLTTQVEDFDQFKEIFSTKGAEKRKQHGSKGSTVFRDPNEEDRVWAIFDWDEDGFQNFVSDPEVPPILQEAGHKGRPEVAVLAGQFDASSAPDSEAHISSDRGALPAPRSLGLANLAERQPLRRHRQCRGRPALRRD